MAEDSVAFESGLLLKKNVRERFQQGRLDAHIWNDAVGKRIASLAADAPAVFLGIEGLNPFPRTLPDTQDNIDTWLALPKRPNKLNKNVFAMRGDSDYKNLPAWILGNLDDDPETIKNLKDYMQNYATAEGINSFIEAVEPIGTAAIVFGVSAVLSKETTNIRSRRWFLGTGATAAAGVVAAPILQVFSPTEQGKDIAQNVANLTASNILSNTWHEGRAALLIAKTTELLSHVEGKWQSNPNFVEQAKLPKEPGSKAAVVMNAEHQRLVKKFEDRAERAKAIRVYAELMIKAGKNLYAYYHKIPLEEVPPSVTNEVLRYLSYIQVTRVIDPGGPDEQPDFPSKIDSYMHPSVGALFSKELEDATKDLEIKT